MSTNMTARNNRFKRTAAMLVVAAFANFSTSPAFAVDPPYQDDMRRLNEIMGSLYFLQPLCTDNPTDWRALAADLIDLDKPDDDRRERLMGAFNEGYESYARLYRWCSEPAATAMTRLITEAEHTARDIHSRYAE